MRNMLQMYPVLTGWIHACKAVGEMEGEPFRGLTADLVVRPARAFPPPPP